MQRPSKVDGSKHGQRLVPRLVADVCGPSGEVARVSGVQIADVRHPSLLPGLRAPLLQLTGAQRVRSITASDMQQSWMRRENKHVAVARVRKSKLPQVSERTINLKMNCER